MRGAMCVRAAYFNLMHPMRGAINSTIAKNLHMFQSNALRAEYDGKTIQSKYALVAHRMYSIAN